MVLGEGEFLIIPRGVGHKPVADDEGYLVLLEKKTNTNTGSDSWTRPLCYNYVWLSDSSADPSLVT